MSVKSTKSNKMEKKSKYHYNILNISTSRYLYEEDRWDRMTDRDFPTLEKAERALGLHILDRCRFTMGSRYGANTLFKLGQLLPDAMPKKGFFNTLAQLRTFIFSYLKTDREMYLKIIHMIIDTNTSNWRKPAQYSEYEIIREEVTE